MKKVMFLALASGMLWACSDNNDPSQLTGSEPENGAITFQISAVNELSAGIPTKGNLYSQEAVQHVTRVSIYAFLYNNADYVYTKTYTIPDWTDGTTFKRYTLDDSDKLAAGTYKFLAVGRDATDKFNISAPSSTSTYSSMIAQIAKNGDEEELFAGWADATVTANGARVSIEMTRKVAGILGYFVNIPQTINSQTVRYLRLNVSNANQTVNLATGSGINTAATPFNIIDMDLSGQPVTNGIYTGNDLSGQGVVKVVNSQLSGAYYMPVSGVTMTLGLYAADGTALKTWTVQDSNGSTTNLDLLANHFYSLGIKAQAGNTTGGTPEPGDDDAPVDLMTDQNIIISISPAWELIHNLVIQPQ